MNAFLRGKSSAEGLLVPSFYHRATGSGFPPLSRCRPSWASGKAPSPALQGKRACDLSAGPRTGDLT
ncbi:unnamed protein product, partial [Gulo gulo]